jgi:uncharacterized peroxidase-related enzyme
MAWIKTIPYEEAEGKLLNLYDRVKGPDNNVDNIMLAHSLRPHTMEGHMSLYKYSLHHPSNTVPKWFLETVGVYASMLNNCQYCIEHHFAGLARLVKDEERSNAIRSALETGILSKAFDLKEVAALEYVHQLTKYPGEMKKSDVDSLLNTGWEDGEILEINQVTAYFNYANRTVLGLGIDAEGDILGLSPNDSDDPDNWQHK